MLFLEFFELFFMLSLCLEMIRPNNRDLAGLSERLIIGRLSSFSQGLAFTQKL